MPHSVIKDVDGQPVSLEAARDLLEQGSSGRMQLEDMLGYDVCGISGCVSPARHSGECCRAERTDGRKRKPKAAFEPDAPELHVQRKPKSPRGFAKEAARRPSAAGPSAQQRVAEHSTALVPAPSTQLVLSMNAEALDEIPNMRTAPDFLSTFKQAHPNPFSPIADVSDNALEAESESLRIDLRWLNGFLVLTLADNGRGMTEKGVTDCERG